MVLLVALAVAAHAVTVGADFVLDDKAAILSNPVVQGDVDPMAAWTRDYWGRPAHEGVATWRPVPVLSFWLDWRLGGGAPWAFHSTNVLLHALTVAALFVAVRRHVADLAIAFGAAALFAVLPVGTEAVAGIVGRADVLAALFCFLTWWATSTGRAVVSALAFSLALLSKESAIAFPACLLAMDLLAAGRPDLRRAVGRTAPLVAVTAAVIALRAYLYEPLLAGQWDPFDNPLAREPLGVRLATGPWLLILALRQILFPLWLSPDHSFAQIAPVRSIFSVECAVGSLILGTLAWAAWRYRSARPALTLGMALFLPSWAAVSNVAHPLPTIFAERLLYLPAAGVAISVAGIAFGPPASPARRRAFAALCAAGLAGTVLAASTWRDDLSLFSRAVVAAPRSARAWTNYGAALVNADRPGEALGPLQRATTIAPERPEAWSLLGPAQYSLGRNDEAERSMRRAVALDPDSVQGTFNLALLLARADRLAEARDVLAPFVARHPDRDRERALLRQIDADLGGRSP